MKDLDKGQLLLQVNISSYKGGEEVCEGKVVMATGEVDVYMPDQSIQFKTRKAFKYPALFGGVYAVVSTKDIISEN